MLRVLLKAKQRSRRGLRNLWRLAARHGRSVRRLRGSRPVFTGCAEARGIRASSRSRGLLSGECAAGPSQQACGSSVKNMNVTAQFLWIEPSRVQTPAWVPYVKSCSVTLHNKLQEAGPSHSGFFAPQFDRRFFLQGGPTAVTRNAIRRLIGMRAHTRRQDEPG